MRSIHGGRGTPYYFACIRGERDSEIEAFLIEKQSEAVAALKMAYELVVVTRLGMPDLVVALMWSFAKPDLREALDGW